MTIKRTFYYHKLLIFNYLRVLKVGEGVKTGKVLCGANIDFRKKEKISEKEKFFELTEKIFQKKENYIYVRVYSLLYIYIVTYILYSNLYIYIVFTIFNKLPLLC